MTVEAFAPAKVNLALHITGQRDDGYHLLDSFVAFADVGDRLSVAAAATLSLSVDGPRAEGIPTGDDNLVLKAARMMDPKGRAAIALEKNLPSEAGIGGGSSDAAAAMRALSTLWDVPLPGAAATVTLGADVPVCMAPKMQRMQGIGETLTPISGWPKLPCVLVNAGRPVPTGAVFKALKSRENAPLPARFPTPSTVSGGISWLASHRNDLEHPAGIVVPEIRDVIAALSALDGCGLARMSGSGGTCFGLFESFGAAVFAASELKKAQPDWWIKATKLS